MDLTYLDLAKMIDHSLLNPTMDGTTLDQGIEIALKFDVASVCILPYYLKTCAERLQGSTVKASTTIGFPHGGHTTEVKLAEARRALADGGQELDMVVNISRVLSKDWSYVENEIKALTDLCHEAGQKIKVIFENCYLEDDHKKKLCEICSKVKADWVKTSSGYGTGGATIEDLKLMRKYSDKDVQVKAAGGVRDVDKQIEVKNIGVSRIGASRTVSMMNDWRKRLGMEEIVLDFQNTGAGSY